MRSAQMALCLLGILLTRALAQSTPPAISKQSVVIAADMVLDGKGHVLRNTHIVVEGSKIVALDSKAKPVDYDLRGLTVLPGWIDAHVHIAWSFGKDGKNAGEGAGTPE